MLEEYLGLFNWNAHQHELVTPRIGLDQNGVNTTYPNSISGEQPTHATYATHLSRFLVPTISPCCKAEIDIF